MTTPGEIEVPDYPVVVVETDDWRAIYLFGNCVYQGHDVELAHLQKYLPGHTVLDDIGEWFEDEFYEIGAASGRLPDKLYDLVDDLRSLRKLEATALALTADYEAKKEALLQRRGQILES